MTSLICGILKKIIHDTNELTYKTETNRLRKQTYGCQRDGIVRVFGMDMYTLKYLKWLTNKDLFVQHMELCPMLYGSLEGSGV